MIATGAGSELRRVIGTATFWGTLGVTLFGLFLTPVFYVVIRRAVEGRNRPAGPGGASSGVAVLLVAGVAGLLLAGCAAGPDYRTPETRVAGAFTSADQAGFSAGGVETNWWGGFQDPLLNRLVSQTIATNHDLRIATARVREARALHRTTTLDIWPTVTAGGGYTKSLGSKDAARGLPRPQRELELFDAGFDATWELDLFGRVRRSVEAGRAGVAALEASRRQVCVSLISEVARNYFELRGVQLELAVARRNADNQRETLGLSESKLQAGRGTELDTARARAQLHTTLAGLPPLEAARQQIIHRLGVLTGQAPTALAAELATVLPLPSLPALVNIGRPEDLLRRRPDIQAAERALAAATARIGMATADLFPRLTFNGQAGLAAGDFSGLSKAGADNYSFGPRLSWAALDLGRVRARLRAAGARAEGELAAYERTVLLALEETEDALVEFDRTLARREQLRSAAKAAEAAARLANDRYAGGVAEFLIVLDAQRTLLAIQGQLAQSETRAATSLVAIYKALGGGWELVVPVGNKATQPAR
jgi:multidrug efflux system outer membrane protein